jgi:hypothetical protein
LFAHATADAMTATQTAPPNAPPPTPTPIAHSPGPDSQVKATASVVGRHIHLAWTANPRNRVALYTLRLTRPHGRLAYDRTVGHAGHLTLPVPKSGSYSFEVRTSDSAGHDGNWVSGGKVRDAGSLRHSSHWQPLRSGRYFAGESLRSASRGARVTQSSASAHVTFFVSRGPRAGIADLLVDGHVVGRVDLYAPSRLDNQRLRISARGRGNHIHRYSLRVEHRKRRRSHGFDVMVEADAAN